MTPIDAAELPPFTADQKQALRECRFVTTNLERTFLLASTPDKAVADAVGVACTPYQPDKTQDPGRWEYEILTAHPEAVTTAVEIMARQDAARALARANALPGASVG